MVERSAALVSEVLDVGAAGYAAAATELLLERHPSTARPFGSRAFSNRTAHLTTRLRQLSADAGATSLEQALAEARRLVGLELADADLS